MKRKDEFSRTQNELVRRKIEHVYRRYQSSLLNAAMRWKRGQNAPFYGFDVLPNKLDSERQHHHLHANIAVMYEVAIEQLAKEFDFPLPKPVDNRPPSMPGLAGLRRALEADLRKATGREVRL